MKKLVLIGWKDLVLTFRDLAALVLMLAAPFALTLGLGFVTGRFSDTSSSGVSGIGVILVNLDGAQIGNELVKVFQSEELATLVDAAVIDDPESARRQVDEDQAAAAVIIPAGFTRSVIPAEGSASVGEVAQIELYSNPTRPTGVGIVETIVEEFVNQVDVATIGAQVAVTQLLSHGLIRLQDAAHTGAEIGIRQAAESQSATSITLKDVAGGGEAVTFDALAYMAPGMALMFLMFTVANGGRTLLQERTRGTLPRLLVSPTTAWQVLGGKVFGVFATGAAQMLILILASTLLFRLDWGDPLAVLVLVLAAVAGATGWGLLITALVKTVGQVNAVGTAVMLSFGILGGSFINMDNMPAWFRLISKISPNAWGIDGFTTLAMGGRLTDIIQPVTGLLVMGCLLFAVAVLILNRRGITQQ